MKIPWINKRYLRKKAAKITTEDVKKAVDNSDSIRTKFESVGPLGRYLKDVKLLLSLVTDYWTGQYRAIPWWAIAAVVFSLLYVVNPLDLIPDFIPVIGYVDDAAVISACLMLVEQELDKYRKWKETHLSS